MKKSTWNLLSYILIFVAMFGTSQDPAEDLVIIARLESYVIPVFWTVTDEKVMLFLMIRFKKAFRIYQFS
jgi:hypothetical protein